MAIAAHKDDLTLKAALRNLIEKLGTSGAKTGKKKKAGAEGEKSRTRR